MNDYTCNSVCQEEVLFFSIISSEIIRLGMPLSKSKAGYLPASFYGRRNIRILEPLFVCIAVVGI